MLPFTVVEDPVLRLVLHLPTIGLVAVCYALIEVSIPRLVAAYTAEPGLMGQAQGGTSSCRSVGFVVGSVAAGTLYDLWGLLGAYILSATVAFFGVAAIAVAYMFGEVQEQTK